jgi:hypothetical protein
LPGLVRLLASRRRSCAPANPRTPVGDCDDAARDRHSVPAYGGPTSFSPTPACRPSPHRRGPRRPVRRSVVAALFADQARNCHPRALSHPPSSPRTRPDHGGISPGLARLGEVAEWLNAPHSKCGIGASLSGVRIPPSPPVHCSPLFAIIRNSKQNQRSTPEALYFAVLRWSP